MRPINSLLLSTALLAGTALSAHADVNVVASIKPVHSLVAAVMEGVGEPGLIVEGAASPHAYALKPSQAQMLEDADLVFWIGEDLESFLERPLANIAAKAKTVEMMDAHDLIRLELREGGAFEKHDHSDDEEHAGEAGHDHDHGHDHEKVADAGHDHDHAHGAFDAHIWLDPVNAKAMVHEIEEALVAADPANAATYEANAAATMAKLDALIADIDSVLEPVKNEGFIVFHDGYQYFENRFGVSAVGSITVSPEVMPGAARVSEIREQIGELGATCVFAEPQFEPKLVSTVTEGTNARGCVLDPIGAGLDDGPDLYFELITGMASSIKTCLSQDS